MSRDIPARIITVGPGAADGTTIRAVIAIPVGAGIDAAALRGADITINLPEGNTP